MSIAKTELIGTRVTPSEKKLIAIYAKEEKLSVSEYLRKSVMDLVKHKLDHYREVLDATTNPR